MSSLTPYTPSTSEAELFALLSTIFDGGSLRRFIVLHYGSIALEIPTEGSLARLAFSATLLLRQHGFVTATLFIRLIKERPGQVSQIVACAESWKIDIAPHISTRVASSAKLRLIKSGIVKFTIFGVAAMVLPIYLLCGLDLERGVHECEVVPPTIDLGRKVTGGFLQIKSGHTVEIEIVETAGVVTGLKFDCLTTASQGSLNLHLAGGQELRWANLSIAKGEDVDLRSVRTELIARVTRAAVESRRLQSDYLDREASKAIDVITILPDALSETGTVARESSQARSLGYSESKPVQAVQDAPRSLSACNANLKQCVGETVECVVGALTCTRVPVAATMEECEARLQSLCGGDALDSGRPEHIDYSALVSGIRPAREQARRECLSRSARSELVKIKLSLNGRKGRVRSWDILSSGGNSSLASCLAEVLQRDVQLSTVQREIFGVQVTFDFRSNRR